MNFPQLANNIRFTHEILQNNAFRAINQNITVRNWLVGFWIVEFEQNGEDRAKYGDKLLDTISKTISVKGLGVTTLSQCRKFYLTYPTIGIEINKYLHNQKYIEIFQTTTEKLPQIEPAKLFNNLSFSHFAELIYIDEPLKRVFYEIETIKGCWSVKELKRQIESSCYERSNLSNKPELLTYLYQNICYNSHQRSL